MTDKSRIKRREFLSKLTAVVGGTATAAVVAPIVNASPVVSEKSPEVKNMPSKGYQRTEHVNKYYQLADF
jgi:hypothetical protein